MENKDLQQYIQDIVQLQVQVKFFHWQTKIYAKQKSFLIDRNNKNALLNFNGR